LNVLAFLSVGIFSTNASAREETKTARRREYQIKAAFMYNFAKFVDWPEEKLGDSNEPIIIGIIGDDSFEDAFEPIKRKKIKGRRVLVQHFASLKQNENARQEEERRFEEKIKALKRCHMLFVCRSEKKNLEKILKLLQGSAVLTVGEVGGFLESGGIINFLIEDKKIRYEINLCAAKCQRLRISAQLLRLARKIKDKDCPKQSETKDKAEKTSKSKMRVIWLSPC